MSKIKGIEKRRFFSFFIYHLIAIWILSGCAAKSSMDSGVSGLQSPALVKKANIESRDEIQYLAASAVEGNNTATDQDFEKYTESSEPHMLLTPIKSSDKQIIGIIYLDTLIANALAPPEYSIRATNPPIKLNSTITPAL